MKHIKIVSILLIILILPLSAYGESENEYLILNDIGNNKLKTHSIDSITRKLKPIESHFISKNSGVVIGGGHFQDHLDMTYETTYLNHVDDIAVKVQVTQHAGADSDQWLLHEIERSFRYGDYEEDMTPSKFRNIDGNNMFYSMLGGGIIAG